MLIFVLTFFCFLLVLLRNFLTRINFSVKMFRLTYKWFVIPRSIPVVPSRSFCVQNSESVASRKSGNQIKLIGRVKNEVLRLQNGFDSFHIRTATKGLGNLIGVLHNIKARNDSIEVPKLTDNDLVYVNGEIVYENEPNGEKFISVPHILAKKIVHMENDNKSDDLEQLVKECVNEVKLLGTIGSNILDENATVFHVVTNAELTPNLNTKFFHGDWHRVLIFDEHLREFVRNHLKITDRLLINGEIFYHKVDLEDGGVAKQGNILARRIQKLQRFSKGGEDEPQNTQATMEQ
ncbi:uncharacterized protein LOC129570041 [Sitodiplosis mosellana]|uniref:uncharacterized protein LOC129570041 n=1 Tax=Sitodiplosis mosellana TaxID=263140 RepID=UPI0024449307|nr:uncharacterized protein LOC129570041 [Sitodiplosis mosellana]